MSGASRINADRPAPNASSPGGKGGARLSAGGLAPRAVCAWLALGLAGLAGLTVSAGLAGGADAAAAAEAAGAAAPGRPRVVTSCLPLHCWAANVAGDAARVENLLPPRAEPHDYAFTPGDARRLDAADLVVVNGLGLEPWLAKWERAGAGTGTGARNIANISQGVGELVLRGAGGGANPHLWMDPLIACAAVSNIAAALQRIDPPHAAAYRSNALAYVARLQQLDRDLAAGLAGITNRALVTYHDAFPYFARRYGLEIAGVVEKVPEVNPTPKYLARLAGLIRARGIRVLFIGRNSASRLARQIAEDLGVKLVELDTLETGELAPDTYERALRGDLRVLQEALR